MFVLAYEKVRCHPQRIVLAQRAATLVPGYVWWDLAQIDKAPLPAPVKKLLAQLAAPTLFT